MQQKMSINLDYKRSVGTYAIMHVCMCRATRDAVEIHNYSIPRE